MAMPEAAMDKYDCAETRKDQIWASRQACPTKAVSESESVQCTPYLDLDFCILATDARHHPAPCFHVDYVGHADIIALTKEMSGES